MLEKNYVIVRLLSATFINVRYLTTLTRVTTYNLGNLKLVFSFIKSQVPEKCHWKQQKPPEIPKTEWFFCVP